MKHKVKFKIYSIYIRNLSTNSIQNYRLVDLRVHITVAPTFKELPEKLFFLRLIWHFFIVFIRSGSDIRWKGYKNMANSRSKKHWNLWHLGQQVWYSHSACSYLSCHLLQFRVLLCNRTESFTFHDLLILYYFSQKAFNSLAFYYLILINQALNPAKMLSFLESPTL